jgi:hypothetical protein
MIVHAKTKIGIVCGVKKPRRWIDWKKFFHIEPASRCKNCHSTLTTPVSEPAPQTTEK